MPQQERTQNHQLNRLPRLGCKFLTEWVGQQSKNPGGVSRNSSSQFAYTARVFALLPDPFRQKFAAKTWQAVELMILRSLLLRHVAPVIVIALMVGFLEGSWARASQKALVKMHSPMRFSLALMGLSFTPVLSLLWIAAPLVVPTTLFVFTIGAVAIVSTRNLVVHAPTQF